MSPEDILALLALIARQQRTADQATQVATQLRATNQELEAQVSALRTQVAELTDTARVPAV